MFSAHLGQPDFFSVKKQRIVDDAAPTKILVGKDDETAMAGIYGGGCTELNVAVLVE
jgi:hypothetical protein